MGLLSNTRSIFATLIALTALAQASPIAFPLTPEESQRCILAFREIEAMKRELRDARNIPLPEQPPRLQLRRPEAQRIFNSALVVFRSVWSDPSIQRLREIAASGARGNEILDEAAAVNLELKEIRAALKHLRFVYGVLNQSERVPPALDELTTALGKLRDAVQGKRSSPENLREYSRRLLSALEPRQVQRIETEIAAFQPIGRRSFEQRLRSLVAESLRILQEKERTPGEFHDLRKNLQSLLAIAEIQLQMRPTDQNLQAIVHWLVQRTERLGQEHEAWERATSRGELNYKRDRVSLSKPLRRDLQEFLGRI